MTEFDRFMDDLGPERIVQIYVPGPNLKAVVVIDNLARGPAIGGTRMAVDVSVEECVRLARAMTLKNAVADLPHGGAKSVIFADPSMQLKQKEQVIRAFASAITDLKKYIPGPDMGTNEISMAWIHDETERAVGLPRSLGGIPLDEIGATGYGLAIAAEVAANYSSIELEGARLVVQGFGAVGQNAARYFSKRGAILIAASDSKGAIFNSTGLDIERLIDHKLEGQILSNFPDGKNLARGEIVSIACDIWIPAARPDVITHTNVDTLDCKIVIQGANIPVTRKAEQRLHERQILSIPDFVANAGGVICASVEYHGGTESAAFDAIEYKIRRNVDEVLRLAKDGSLLPRDAAYQIAESRVREAMALRRWAQ